MENIIKFINNYKDAHNDLWEEKTKKKWSTLRLKAYILKIRCIDQFYAQFGSRENVIVAYGSAKFNPTGPGEQSVPTSFVSKRCSNMYKTILTDEYRTSITCHNCFKPLENIIENGNVSVESNYAAMRTANLIV